MFIKFILNKPYKHIIRVGNIHEKPLEEIWLESDILNKIRDRRKYDICGECKYLPYCGGCRRSAYQTSNKIDGFDYNCLVNEEVS